jgi:hypothetical protein
MLSLLILVHIKFAKMMTITVSANSGQLVLIQELKCLNSKTTTVQAELTIPKIMCFIFLHFYCIINKYIVWKCIHTVYTVDIYSTGPYFH